MTSLHVYFALRKQQAFQRLLDGPQGPKGHTSSSGGKSWSRTPALSSTQGGLDINAQDDLGRTVLHLTASATDAAATEYVRMLLAHPSINVNLRDKESHWTALHRALYHGNINTALLLLRRPDIDTNLKDLEGYRAFDLYNSTVEGTKPTLSSDRELNRGRSELLTWGTNRNASLGFTDGDDRNFPDQVVLSRPGTSPSDYLEERFEPLRVNQVSMSKLHTAVVTSQARCNVLVCGFGSGGRLGPTSHTQYNLLPIPALSSTTIISVALGQDHTLALTSTGEVYSWGLNRFSQLGYVVDISVSGSGKEEVQSTPRKIAGLRHKYVIGIAACKTASALWTRDEVFTWGTNNGQLGYDKVAQPVQITPRKVAKVTQPVIGVTITDTALICLLENHDVVCIWNDGSFKVNFPSQAFPSEIAAYRPPQAIRNTSIQKVTSCDATIAALSTNGELFTFTLPTPSGAGIRESGVGISVKPQRVWALRKQFSAVKDVELGADGSIIICTESGHVFVRSRNLKGAPLSLPAASLPSKSSSTGLRLAFKFQRIPFLQRVVKVCANSTGAFGAIRLDAEPGNLDITTVGSLIQGDLRTVCPYIVSGNPSTPGFVYSRQEIDDAISLTLASRPIPEADDEDTEDSQIFDDVQRITRLCRILDREVADEPPVYTLPEILSQPSDRLPHGADLLLRSESGHEFLAHRLVCATRSSVFRRLLCGANAVNDKQGSLRISYQPISGIPPRPLEGIRGTLEIKGTHPLSILILLEYLYSDDVLAVWDPRIAVVVGTQLRDLCLTPMDVKQDLIHLADALELPILRHCVEAPVKRHPPGSMASDFMRLMETHVTPEAAISSSYKDPTFADVIILLGDREVQCHSTILRARSDFFANFFRDAVWTRSRWTAEGTIRVNLKHLKWNVMKYVIWYIYGGDSGMFDRMESVNTSDELVEFMFSVIAAANELLLDRLVLLCSSVILKRLTIWNASFILAEATHFHSVQLTQHIQQYIARNLETMLEGYMINDLPIDLVRQLSGFIQQEQLRKSPVSRSGKLVSAAMETFKGWLGLQDIPGPIERKHSSTPRIGLTTSDSAKLSPPSPSRRPERRDPGSPSGSPIIRPHILTHPTPSSSKLDCVDDGVFLMDVGETPIPHASTSSAGQVAVESPRKVSGGWKVSAIPKVDMKVIMAEAQTAKPPSLGPIPSTPPRINRQWSKDSPNWRTPPRPGGAPGENVTGLPQGSAVSSSSRKSLPGSNPLTGNASISRPSLPGPSRTDSLPAKTTGLRADSSDAYTKVSPVPPKIPGMGPTFSPSKASLKPGSGAPIIRRVPSGGTVWSSTLQPSVPEPLPSGSAMSFAAIQQLQQQQSMPLVQDKRSLKQIQEEEESRRAEEEFLKWWAAEEERVRQEQLSQEASAAKSRNRPPRKPKGGKGKGNDKRQVEQSEGAANSSASAPRSSTAPSGSRGDSTRRTRHKGPKANTLST